MAARFRISIHRNSENLHLKLMGDFDGTSAHELLNVLKRYSTRTARIFIHTRACVIYILSGCMCSIIISVP